MKQIDQMQLLLDKVERISSKYRRPRQGSECRFNVFTILRPEDDEVNLHSRFLAELLDPQGTHGQGDAFIAAFFRCVGIEGFRLKNVSVRQEYRNVDILASNADQALVIENKISAQDQERQLDRYYLAMREEGFDDIFLVYLSLDGSEPSRYSLGKLVEDLGSERLYLVSYKDDIHAWLRQCVDISDQHPILRETLLQYQRLVERLTGQFFSKGHVMEIKDLLIDERNIELAVGISEALVEAQIDIQLAFWQALERRLDQAGFRAVEGKPYSNKYNRKKVRKYYQTKSAGWHYGITVKLADIDDETELVFYIKARRHIDYGFRVYQGDTSKIAQEPRFDALAAIAKQVQPSMDRSKYSLGYTTVPRFHFDGFHTPTVFALADPDKREQIVGDFAAEMVVCMKQFMSLYERTGAQLSVDGSEAGP